MTPEADGVGKSAGEEQPDDKIRIQNVGLSFGKGPGAVNVLAGIDLTIRDGEFVTIIGPSGSGKSTLLNLISSTLDHVEGTFQGAIDIDWHSDARNRLGYVLQKDTLLPWRNLEENVAVGLEIMGMEPAERSKLTREWIHRMGLNGFENAYPYALSGGMRQRVNIIRTLICNPEVVLMDEPFGALDAQTRMILQQLLIELWHAAKKTICFVTHDLEESILLGDRVVLLGPRPATVRAIYPIDIPHPRDVIEVKATREFQEIYRRIWNDLKESIPSQHIDAVTVEDDGR